MNGALLLTNRPQHFISQRRWHHAR